jgi:hypothetical protein
LLTGALAAALVGLVVVGSPAAASEGHEPDGAHGSGPSMDGHQPDDHPTTVGSGSDGHDDGTSDDGTSDDGASDDGPAAGKAKLKARLSGLNEVVVDPATGTAKTGGGALQGTGRATVRVRNGTRLCWNIRAEGIGPAVMAHIHKGEIGANGGVVVDFNAKFTGCTTIDAALAADIVARPESYYVNVHTADFMAGAIRGQLRVEAEEVEFKARLNGANEVDNTGKAGVGDPDGRGKLDVDLRGTLLCWKFRAEGLEPVAAQHIHKGAAGTNGPIVVDFDGNARGCRDITATLAEEIAANPAGYYGNMHTAGFAAGAIRGQLMADD